MARKRLYEPRISSAIEVHRAGYSEMAFEVFLALSQLPCHYCGLVGSNSHNRHKSPKSSPESRITGDFVYNGLDRIDITQPHTINNVLPCCRHCNYGRNVQPYRAFLNHVIRIYNHLGLSTDGYHQ